MFHPKQHIVDLVEILIRKGISKVIISPGSRNAPLIEAFYRRLGNKCISIVDERSAGYVALGIARNSGKPAVLVCTSGTAVLNYGPAIAEAFHQQIPLIVCTADRPVEWINQLDNQTLKQDKVFSNFVKKHYNLPQNLVKEDDLWFVHRTINEAYNSCVDNPSGPVHINIALCEPLYDALPQPQKSLKIIEHAGISIDINLPDRLIEQWKRAQKILIVHGQDIPASKVADYLNKLTYDPRVSVIGENISNIHVSKQIENPDLILTKSDLKELVPDLLIVSGLQVVSKKLKLFLRKVENMITWRVGLEEDIIDTYKQVDEVIKCTPDQVYKELGYYLQVSSESNYQKSWSESAEQAKNNRSELLKGIPFSDLKVFEIIFQSFPEKLILELGNSSVIRYSQLFDIRKDHIYYSNRGISGIDGCLSTAVGTALSTDRLVLAIVGDLSFVYDSNALWNRDLPSNLRIIVINNQGGGIFHLLTGPKNNSSFNDFVNAWHPVHMDKLAQAFGLGTLVAENESDLKEILDIFFKMSDKPLVLEVKTSTEISADCYKQLLGNKTNKNNG
jgi:2-succinyl-5-enolpyruvyl-6-hydroxy-3-cyclohexene-1-carboxylate synthase